MKYKEFKEKVKELGYGIDNGYDRFVYVVNYDKETLISINKNERYSINSDYSSFGNLNDEYKRVLLRLSYELASTPLDEREDEKKYYLKLDSTIIPNLSYLNFSEYDGEFEISSKNEYEGYKTAFTESEIKELEKEHDLSIFVKEEVEWVKNQH